MNKFIKKLVLISLGVTAIFSTPYTASASFTDVSIHNKYYDAINYLQENGIINGYSDGTFKPFQTVNRAEFLKIIIEGSNIPLDVNSPTPFNDVQTDSWYTKYIQKAYSQGWINGYEDGTFKPEQTISKVEALKILGKAQDWQISPTVNEQIFTDTDNSSWYIGYVKYAKDHSYLEETGPLFLPLNQMSRGQISEIIFRSISDPSTTVETTDPTPTLTTDNTTAFHNITLESDLPETFFTNEIYVINGTVSTQKENTSISAIIENTITKERKFVSAAVTNNNFALPITFASSGTYKIGLIPNSETNSNAILVAVSSLTIPPTSEETSPEKPTNLSLSFKDDSTTFNFSGTSVNTIKKITFTQGNISKIFISRQDLTSIPLIYSSFENFREGNMSAYLEIAKTKTTNPITISSAFAKSDTINFTATEHTFDMISTASITTTAPDTVLKLNTISFTGKAKTDIQDKAYIIKADGLAETSKLTTSGNTGEYFGVPTIKSGSNFSFSYTPETIGRYIIAIDNKAGEPIFSHPIYIGTSIPLIPDFFDKNQRDYFSGTFDLNSSRTQLLNLINAAREKEGLATLALAPELNAIAQAHSDDMATNNYFAHVNQSNQTPDDRRIAAKITTPVGENIARDVSIEFSHYSLMRSPSHLINILKTDWERVGLGITEIDGYIYVTEEFSTNPLTAADFSKYKTDLKETINSKRQENGESALEYSIALENATIYLNDNIKNDSSNFTQQLFEEALNNNNIQGSSGVTSISSGSWSDTLSSIIADESSILEPLWKLMGIDITTDDQGLLHTILILNK